jgi:hypothetical protein
VSEGLERTGTNHVFYRLGKPEGGPAEARLPKHGKAVGEPAEARLPKLGKPEAWQATLHQSDPTSGE